MKKIGLLKEISAGESRVAATPETVTKFIKAEFAVHVESQAGLYSHITDADYEKSGAVIEKNPEALLQQADILIKVNKPIFHEKKNYHEIDLIKENSILVAPLFPLQHIDLIKQLNAKKITAFATSSTSTQGTFIRFPALLSAISFGVAPSNAASPSFIGVFTPVG